MHSFGLGFKPLQFKSVALAESFVDFVLLTTSNHIRLKNPPRWKSCS